MGADEQTGKADWIVQFTRIRLSGFKSFVEPTELMIERGLTGVVGPNGCGKSNLLEAIRWVMGENSPKSMRGSGMDDVIFSGTERRPARNLADVTLYLDNSTRSAPSAFNDDPELEISRRIERESGSAYRINGREVRAKDVQLLFADAATGAHSPALVSQGQISQLISAKPRDRRAVLEEAAGVMGLHSRRKEAESRLKAAENNLLRLQDVMTQMEAQGESLKRQARQARRYRNISGDVRRADAMLLHLRWTAATEALMVHENEHREARAVVDDITREAARLTTEHTEISAGLPELRHKEAERAAAVHRLMVERDNLDRELARLEEQEAELRGLLKQVEVDRQREAVSIEDAERAMARLQEEATTLQAEAGNTTSQEAAAAQVLEAAHAAAAEAEERYDALSTQAAELRARRQSLDHDRRTTAARIERLAAELEQTRTRRAEMDGDGDASASLAALEAAVAEKEEAFRAVQDELAVAEAARLEAQDGRDAARDTLAARRNELSAIKAEAKALGDVLAGGRQDGAAAIADDIKVESGYEAALGAALGDDLEAPGSDGGPIGWRTLPPLTPPPRLPDGATALVSFVTAPAALVRRLSQVGVVSAHDGTALAGLLQPGQRLVSREGALWRWDGYYATADAPSAEATRLAQRNRLVELEEAKTAAATATDAAEEAAAAANTAVDAAGDEERRQRAARGEAERALAAARADLKRLAEESSRRMSELGALSEAETRVGRDLDETRGRAGELEREIVALPPLDAHEADLESARSEVEALRARLAEARGAYDSLHRVNEERERRLKAIALDREAWNQRLERSRLQGAELDRREAEAQSRLEQLANAPGDIEARRMALLDRIGEAEEGRSAAADILAQAENTLADKDRELKSTQARLAEARERSIRAEAACENAEDRRRQVAHETDEKFECDASVVLDVADVPEKARENMPDAEALEKRLERLRAERERLGAVNLRADQELQELQEQLEHLETEKADLESAIGRLRQGIGALNREGRERVLAAFKEVDAHFSSLFTQLFGGGHAHLQLTESDDPLEAGLEIMASPPGKKLQSLSLLSGGEQALTAVALIFAVFMTNPAPICVLDEVDAPLDDANVERFCDLLLEIEDKTNTRFLVVTHNAVTMSRMNRLFGVTMAERGVSQLVSVDLERAEELRAVG